MWVCYTDVSHIAALCCALPFNLCFIGSLLARPRAFWPGHGCDPRTVVHLYPLSEGAQPLIWRRAQYLSTSPETGRLQRHACRGVKRYQVQLHMLCAALCAAAAVLCCSVCALTKEMALTIACGNNGHGAGPAVYGRHFGRGPARGPGAIFVERSHHPRGG